MSLRTKGSRLAALALLATCGGVVPAPPPAPGRPGTPKAPALMVVESGPVFRIRNVGGPTPLDVVVRPEARGGGRRPGGPDFARKVELARQIAAENPCPAVRAAHYGGIFDPKGEHYIATAEGWVATIQDCRREGDDWVVEVLVVPSFSHGGHLLSHSCTETYRPIRGHAVLESTFARGGSGPLVFSM